MMKYCGKCGNELYDDDMVCPNCGTPNKAYVRRERTGDTNRRVPNDSINMNIDRWDYTPISMWGYFGYEILFLIPFIGFILLIIFSVGGTRNINLRNFARSYFCLIIILLVLLVLCVIIANLSRPTLYW